MVRFDTSTDMANESEPSAQEARTPGPELRLVDRRAFVGFPPLTVASGLVISDFALQIPDVTFPLNLSGGASRYQRKKLDFGMLELSLSAELIRRKVSEVAGKLPEFSDLQLHFRSGYLEGQARLRTGERTPLTFKAAFDADGEKLAVYLYDVRFYGFATTAAAQVPALLSRAVEAVSILPEVEVRGANGFSTRVLPALVQLAAVGRGYKMPSLDQARLSAAEVSGVGLRLRFASGGLPPATAPDEELLLTLEGARAFADAEALVAQGLLHEARDAYLRLGDLREAHPFAAERLISLLVADPQTHELALDVASSLLRRRERSATALWAEAVIRERRGENARAAERFLALSGLARRQQEDAAAFFAAEAAARAARDHAPQMAVKALHELLGLKPDHLPSLKALARASDQAADRAGAIRAYRRIAALARDPAEAADAHVHMAQLCALTEDDLAGARLHCEAALRLAPDHPDALYQLGELCHRSGEHLRGIKALDRLRDVALGRHEVDRIGRANLLAGLIWESGLDQPDNALLRYREAISLLPGEPEPLYRAARVAEKLGKLPEALAGYQQAVELAGPAPRTPELRLAAHQSLHALARLEKTRLGDPARAREHLEAALALDPRDRVALEELLPYFRATGRAPELADACEKAAAVAPEPAQRAAYWAEAAELYRGRLDQPEKAERLLTSALEADPRNRLALEAMLALAESRRDGGQLCRCLKGLAELSTGAKEKLRFLRRLVVAARDLAFDLDLAAFALTEVLKLEPEELTSLADLCAIHRKRSDMAALASVLAQRARAAENQADRRLASACLRELSQLLEARLGQVGEALVALEKAARLAPEPAVLFELAQLSIRCERPQHARRALEDLLQALPRQAAPERVAEIRALHGKACDLLGDPDAARDSYAAAFPSRRLDHELAERLQALYQESGQLTELTELWAARAQALAAADRREDAAPLYFRSAEALARQGDAAGALTRYNASLEAAPQSENAGAALEAMAELELARGARLEAAKLFARRAKLLGAGRPAARLLLRCAVLCAGSPREEGFLTGALEQDPSFAPARLQRAEVTFDSDPRAALADVEAALAAPVDDPDRLDDEQRQLAVRKAGFAALRAGFVDTARKHLSRFAAERPEQLDVQRELAQLYRRLGDREPLFELLASLWPRLEGADQRAARREYAELALELGRSAAAIDAFRSLLAAEPTELWAAETLLSLLPPDASTPVERQEQVDLLTALAAGASGDPRAELLARRGRLQRALGRLSEAVVDLEAAAQSAARPSLLLREVASVAEQRGDAEAELSAWRRAVNHDPSLATAAAARVLPLATGLLEAARFALAREGFTLAATLPAPAIDADARCGLYLGLADAARGLADAPGAAAALLEASRQGPVAKRIAALLHRAQLLETGGDLPEAISSYRRALELSPQHPAATEGLLAGLRSATDWNGLAEALSSRAAQLPKGAAGAVLAELGLLYLDRLERPEAAEAALRRAAALDPEAVEVRTRLAALLAGQGKAAEAITFYEEAAAHVPPGRAVELLRAGLRLARAQGSLDAALRLARRAHGLMAAEGDDLLELSELLYLRGAVKEALPLQQRLAAEVRFEEDPERATAVLLRLADLAEQAGDLLLAERSLRRVVVERPLQSSAVERLAALVREKSPRESIQLLRGHAEKLAPSEKTTALWVALAARAKDELADLDLAAELLRRACETSATPLPHHRSLVQLFRDAGRTPELMEALLELGHHQLESGDARGALEAYEEEAALAESSGHLDESLQTLRAIIEVCEDEGWREQAAGYERRRAELLRDGKLDLDAAQAALERSFRLSRERVTAQLGSALAERRGLLEDEARWVERTLELETANADRARGLLRLARLQAAMPSSESAERSEQSLRQALRLDPELSEAQGLLQQRLEEQGRFSDLAGLQEELALQQTQPLRRSRLLVEAARTYRDRAGNPAAAAATMLAARAASPDDADITAAAADLLVALGRDSEAAEFDALLLEKDPFGATFERHAAFLRAAGDDEAFAELMLRRAERQPSEAAAVSYLEAAAAFRRAGAEERALLCEDQAFERAPGNPDAFALLRQRHHGEARALAQLLEARADAVPDEAVALLRERAQLLLGAQETLLAAEAFDQLLRVAGDDREALAQRAELAADAGGAIAAQPYDRRLLALGADTLPPEVKVKSLLRLGRAAADAGANQDAADALEQVIALEPGSARGDEALSLLTEVYSKSRNLTGLFDSTLRLAARAGPVEAEALYRRAAALFEDPREALGALLPLAQLRPTDRDVLERAARGLGLLGRHSEAVALREQLAEAVGGREGAEQLLAAALVADQQLRQPESALSLRKRAVELDPHHPLALRALVEEHRRRADRQGLLDRLPQLIAHSDDADDAALSRLELGSLLLESGQRDEARRLFEAVTARGARGAGFSEALQQLEGLLVEQGGEPAALAEVLLSRAELASPGADRAALLLRAAESQREAGDLARAAQSCTAALESRTSAEALLLLAQLTTALGQHARAAEAWVQSASLAPDAALRAGQWLHAVEAFEAAGQRAEARELFERVIGEQPDLLPPAEVAARFERLGAFAMALAHGFGPAVAAHDFSRALALADAAQDPARSQQALFALAGQAPAGAGAQRLASELRQASDYSRLLELARLSAPAEAAPLYEEVALFAQEPPVREAAVSALAEASTEGGSQGKSVGLLDGLFRALAGAGPGVGSADALSAELLERARGLGAATLEQALEHAAARLDHRRPTLLRELFELRRDQGRFPEAAKTLEGLLGVEEDLRARAVLEVELGELFLVALAQRHRARESFERALADDGTSIIAVKHLLSLYDGRAEPDRFVAMAQRLEQLAGPEALGPHRVILANAYESQGRFDAAYELLTALPETPERVQKRIELAERLGRVGEALALHERLARGPEALERVMHGYLEAGLTPAVARIAAQLAEAGALSMSGRRRVAERLSTQPDGAELAVRLWPALLQQQLADVDGWTLFGEALAIIGRAGDAAMADGFGGALSGSVASAELRAAPDDAERASIRKELSGTLPPLPQPRREVTAEQMPRLHASLTEALAQLGRPGARIWLNPIGGIEAYLAEEGALVLGAAALSCFGAPELSFLCALAVCLGDRGEALSRPGSIPGLIDACEQAFDLYPSSLAASRVLAQIDERVRGGDPFAVRPDELLPSSELFQAIARKALEKLDRRGQSRG